MMTMTGLILGVGMIVDASVVMIDNIYAYRMRGTKAHVAAVLGTQEMIVSVISGNLTTICVFIPFLFFMKDLGFMGQMFKGIIFTIVIALVCSLFVAIFLVPVLAGHFLPLTNRNEKPVKSAVFKFLYGTFERAQKAIEKVYGWGLKKALNHRIATICVCMTALVISFMFVPTLRIQMMTGGHDDSVTVKMVLPVGTSLEETTDIVQQFEKIVMDEIKGIKNVITSIGSGSRNATSYTGQIQIQLPPSDRQIDNDQTIQKKLRAHFGVISYKSLSHFEFISLHGVRVSSNVIDLLEAIQFGQHHLLKRFFPFCIVAFFVED